MKQSQGDCTGTVKNSNCTPARRVLSLDGLWQIGEGARDTPPGRFDSSVTVPGLVDMATPAFDEVGIESSKREAFWYKRTFRVDGPIPAVARLKLHKAMFSSRVILNGRDLGEHRPSFTPGTFDVRPALKEGENEIIVRVGVRPGGGQKAPGSDYEKKKYSPGIYDSVEVILSGAPHIERVQVVPDIEQGTVTIHSWLTPAVNAPLRFVVREAVSRRVVGEASGSGPVTLAIKDCSLWSPDSPFLYELEVSSEADVLTTRFGMRSFRFDPKTGLAMLNGRPYYMRGSNVTFFRFLEDADRGDLPWNAEWVRKLHRKFKEMHWNSLRYSIGFPPDFWYEIADEEGFLIQDEYPLWNGDKTPGNYDAAELADEFRDWMQGRWNHPCVVIWDSCNETNVPETGLAIAKVRGLDLSGRPWDNGWGMPGDPGDCHEAHPYHFYDANAKLSVLATADPTGDNVYNSNGHRNDGTHAIIINEYGWLWLTRDGLPTILTAKLYNNLLGPDSTTEQRRHLSARYFAADTEFWRCHRKIAGVMQFTALGYSRHNGETSDNWLNVADLTWEPEFFRYVGDAFAPVGLMQDYFEEKAAGGTSVRIPVIVINDLYEPWATPLTLRLTGGERVITELQQSCSIEALGRTTVVFEVKLPEAAGAYVIDVELRGVGGRMVHSVRELEIVPDICRFEKGKK